jgi:TRAP transporter TAXI family solute receptor
MIRYPFSKKEISMKYLYKSLLGFGILIGMFGASANAADPVNLRFATVGVGSAWYNYGAGIAEIIKPALPEGSGVEVLPIAGGVGNVKLVQSGEAELGISFPMNSAEGCTGTGVFETKQDKVRALLGGLDIYYFGTFVTTASGVESWDDIIAGKNGFGLLTAKAGGTGELGVRQVLNALGSTYEDIASKGGSVKALARAATTAAIADGSAQGWAHVVTKGHPVATELTTTTDMTMLPLPDKAISELTSKHGWIEAEIPANTFKGQTEPIKTVKAASNILVNADVSEDIVYAITKAIIENADKVQKVHAALGDFDPKEAANPALNGGCPFHPGAEKYYKEAGLMK